MVHLQPGDLRLDRGVVAIVGKACSLCRECRDNGGRWQPKDVDEREIPLLDDLRAYLTPLMPLLRRRRWVLGDDKTRPALQELSKDFARLTRKAGLVGGVQTLRHTFGSHMADDGVPIRVLQGWMGHENLTTTEQYTSTGKSDVDHAKEARPLDLSEVEGSAGLGYRNKNRNMPRGRMVPSIGFEPMTSPMSRSALPLRQLGTKYGTKSGATALILSCPGLAKQLMTNLALSCYSFKAYMNCYL